MPTPLQQAQDKLAQNLVGLPQLADLAFQRLHLVSDLPRDTGTLAAGDIGLLDPFMQRLRNAADLFGNRYHGRPSERVVPLVNENHPHRSLADFRRKPVRRLARHGSTFSGAGASDKPGAVQILGIATVSPDQPLIHLPLITSRGARVGKSTTFVDRHADHGHIAASGIRMLTRSASPPGSWYRSRRNRPP